ncbi:MAG: hypothetical protein ABW004_05610 [Aeromicrobium sp.]
MTSELVALVAARPGMTGSFAFHGDWFGRPFDNQHRIVDAVDLPDDTVEVRFDAGELLVLRGARGVELVEQPRDDGYASSWILVVKDVTSLMWQWGTHTRKDGSEHLLSITQEVDGDHVTDTQVRVDGTWRRRARRAHLQAVALHLSGRA